MTIVNNKSISIILKNEVWKEDAEIISFFESQAKLIEDTILLEGDKSSDELISYNDYIETYKTIEKCLFGLSNYVLKTELLASSALEQQIIQASTLGNIFLRYYTSQNRSVSFLFSQMAPIFKFINTLSLDFDKLDFEKESFENAKNEIIKKLVSIDIDYIENNYTLDNTKRLSDAKKLAEEYGLNNVFLVDFGRVENIDIEVKMLERQDALTEKSRRSILDSAWEIEKYLNNNPNIQYFAGRPVKEVVDKLITSCLWYTANVAVDMKYNDFHILKQDRLSGSDSFYQALSFYPNCKLFKERNGLNNISIMGHLATDEVLEVLYSYAMTIGLKNTDIRATYSEYHGNITGGNLVAEINNKFLRYLGRDKAFKWYTDFFKVKGYRAVAIHCLQVAYNDEYNSICLNKACLEIVQIAIEECPELSLNDFGLTEDIINKVSKDELTAKQAFENIAYTKLFSDEVMAKKHLIIPTEKNNNVNELNKPRVKETSSILTKIVQIFN